MGRSLAHGLLVHSTMSEPLRWAIGGVCLTTGVCVIVMNWLCVMYRRSWVPLIGGMIGSSGLAVLPIVSVWWVPLLVDFGSAPGLALTAVAFARRRTNS